uniref:Uncharacterized protein n=1 Tax=Magnetococcus massalia (strain MO-1) TaxID=451514 RepID=A0A1S7LIE2_MAGMO|nr:conserved protein of unknown function [Candidatus Magnetococcus massalia]
MTEQSVEESEQPAEHGAGMRILKVGVIVGGIALLIGFTTLLIQVMQKKGAKQTVQATPVTPLEAGVQQLPMVAKGAIQAQQKRAAANNFTKLALPEGSKVVSITPFSHGVVVRATTMAGERLYFLNAQGEKLGETRFTQP